MTLQPVLTSHFPVWRLGRGATSPSSPVLTAAAAPEPGLSEALGSGQAQLHLLRSVSPCPSSAFSLQCRRHYSYRQVSLSFYGRKMNCLPSSGAERDDRTESCYLLWFWQPQNRVFSPQPPLDGRCTPGIYRGKSKNPQPNCSQMHSPTALPVNGCVYL